MKAQDAAKDIIAVGNVIATIVPEPYAALIRIAAAGIASAAVALDSGANEADLVKNIHRIRRISA